ncbi:MAG: hypothetical protein JWL83_4660 [Actinomycetia bacterium]|nr:hypothetical protein [Actinomycetes bacterium]
MLKRCGTALGAFAVMGALAVALAGPASAHVTIEPPEAAKGSDAVLAFTVPNEMDNAATTQVVIAFPTDHPIADAFTEPIPGWTAKVERAKAAKPIKTDNGDVTEYVSRITWSGGSIGPGQFQNFSVSVGLPTDTDSLVFKALQTYSNGQVVRWIETPVGGTEPDHPAPTLTLTAAGSSATPGVTTAPAASTTSSKSDSSKGLAVAALVVGIVALLVGAGALARGRTPAA